MGYCKMKVLNFDNKFMYTTCYGKAFGKKISGVEDVIV